VLTEQVETQEKSVTRLQSKLNSLESRELSALEKAAQCAQYATRVQNAAAAELSFETAVGVEGLKRIMADAKPFLRRLYEGEATGRVVIDLCTRYAKATRTDAELFSMLDRAEQIVLVIDSRLIVAFRLDVGVAVQLIGDRDESRGKVVETGEPIELRRQIAERIERASDPAREIWRRLDEDARGPARDLDQPRDAIALAGKLDQRHGRRSARIAATTRAVSTRKKESATKAKGASSKSFCGNFPGHVQTSGVRRNGGFGVTAHVVDIRSDDETTTTLRQCGQ
jgi:hypothetical protein